VIMYPIGSSGQTLVLADAVLAHFRKHRQARPWSREAGGQLFARLAAPEIRLEVATGPRPTDRRGRTYYQPDRRAERKEIVSHHRRGFHYVGDWHTHPSRHPSPSGTDVRNISDCFLHSRHRLAAFVMIIVGTAAPPEGLRVSLHDGMTEYILAPESYRHVETSSSISRMKAAEEVKSLI
jgi:integrative and conjugative element protein (TIGR02256 family)